MRAIMKLKSYAPGKLLITGAIAAILLIEPSLTLADTVLFTASVGDPNNPFSTSVPGTNNVNIPTIDPGVTLTPSSALLDGNITGPLNNVTYGPFGFGGGPGGNTGWVRISDTVSMTGFYQLIWEVAGADPKIGSALLIDNVRVNGNLLFGFESGIPGGFGPLGTVGTSGPLTVTDAAGNPLPNFDPTEGSNFAFMDISGGITPIYDTVDPLLGSRLYSSLFNLSAGDTLTMDMAFMTNEGTIDFPDYGIATLNFVPEPSGLLIASIAIAMLGAAGLIRRSCRRVA
jgi:hypothetical protein